MRQGIQLVRARYVARIGDTLLKRAIDPLPFMKRAGLTPDLVDTPEAWVPLNQFLEFVDNAASDTGYSTLGLDAGIAPRKRHSKFSKMVLYTPTLFQALNTICKNSAYEDTSARFRVVRGTKLGWLECGSVSGTAEGVRQMEYYRYAALLEIIRSAAGPHWLPPELLLASSEGPDSGSHPLLNGTDIRFGQSGLKIAMEIRLFSLPMINVPEVPTTAPAFSESPVEFGQSIVEVVRTQLLVGNPSVGETAKSLRMSARTLQRRLFEQDMSYAALLNYVRTEMAKKWLEETDDAISEIASKLAYRHSTHFSRAFTQTCGLTPREYRRMHGSDGLDQ
jgi:AraC-like DNA-binding protein